MLGIVVLPTHSCSDPQMPAPRCCRIASRITPPQNSSSPPGSSRPKAHLPGVTFSLSALPPLRPQPAAGTLQNKPALPAAHAQRRSRPPRVRGGRALTSAELAGNGGGGPIPVPSLIPFHVPARVRSPQPCPCPCPLSPVPAPGPAPRPHWPPEGRVGGGRWRRALSRDGERSVPVRLWALSRERCGGTVTGRLWGPLGVRGWEMGRELSESGQG